MRLFYSTTSPYARKVRVTAIEKGLAERIECQPVNPYADNAELISFNPLSRVPTLVLNDGTVLYDSPVICEWLDGQAPAPRLLPAGNPAARFDLLRRVALADGMLDDAVAIVMESRRPAKQQSPEVTQARTTSLLRCVDLLESEVGALRGPIDLGQIAVGCALGYLDFRLPQIDWREGRPDIKAWLDSFGERPSMQRTGPELPAH